MEKQLYIVMFRSAGMTGGSNRGVYQVLCTSPEWNDQLAFGSLSFGAAGVKICDIHWITVHEENEDAAIKQACKELNNRNIVGEYEAFWITGEEAIKIEKGQLPQESPGQVSKEIIDKILSVGDLSQAIKIPKDKFNEMTKGQVKDDKNERPEKSSG